MTKLFENKKSYNNYFEYLSDVAPKFHPYLIKSIEDAKTFFETKKHPDLDKYLYGPIIDYTKNPGKMHRPLTLIAAYMACGGDENKIDEIIPIACSIENFQTAALIHDDIADGGKIRRGKECMHLSEGVGVSINAGDFGLSMTVGHLISHMKNSSYSEKKILAIIEKLIFMEYMTIEGQAMDLGWARDNRFDISVKDYICMATKKSAYYSVALPCVLGAICADADNEVIEALDKFGQKIGLAFQIQDDVLNLSENENSKNIKDFRNDITEGKRTYVISLAKDLCKPDDKNRLFEILESKQSDPIILDEAVKILEKCGALNKSIEFAKLLCSEGKDIIKNSLDDSMWKTLLIDMANWAVERGY